MSNSSAKIYDMSDAREKFRAANQDGAGHHIGALLAAAREDLGYSLAEAAQKTQIRQHHLEAIEAMDKAALPGRPYAIGFVRTYAELLSLDAASCVARFKEEVEFDAPVQVAPEEFEAAHAVPTDETRDLSLLAVLAIVGFFIWCAFQVAMLDEPRPLAGAVGPTSQTDLSRAAARLPRAAAPVGENIVEARLIERVEPIYPRGCVENAQPIETVTIAFHITALGRVSTERVAASSNGCFDESALNAVRRWRFEPREVDGAARPVFDQQYSFSFARPR